MRIGFVQYEVAFGKPVANIETARRLIRPRAGLADLLVLPELATSGYKFVSSQECADLAEPVPGGPTTDAWQQIAAETGVALVAGIAEKDGETVYNSAVVVTPGGDLTVYRKLHLYGEENRWFAPGDRPPPVVEIAGARVGVMICFDWFFPETARALAAQGADVICHPANLILPWCQQAMITRSLENHVYTVTANRVGTEDRGGSRLTYTGASQVTGCRGEVLVRAETTGEAVRVVEIDPAAARDKQINPHNRLLLDRRNDILAPLLFDSDD